MAVAKNDAYERLYQRLNAKGGENEVFKLARAREQRTRDLSSVRCIKNADGRVLVEDAKVQDRWQSYFCKLLMDKIWTSPNILSIWPERNNKTTNQIGLSPERRLRRH